MYFSKSNAYGPYFFLNLHAIWKNILQFILVIFMAERGTTFRARSSNGLGFLTPEWFQVLDTILKFYSFLVKS